MIKAHYEKPALSVNKGFCFDRGRLHKSMADVSFKTVPHSLRQLPDKNLILPETPLKSISLIGLDDYTI